MKPKNVYSLLTNRAQELERELFLVELALRKVEEYPYLGVSSNASNQHIAYYQTEIAIIERLQVELEWLIEQARYLE